MTDNGYHFGKTFTELDLNKTEPKTVGIRKSFWFDKSSKLGKEV